MRLFKLFAVSTVIHVSWGDSQLFLSWSLRTNTHTPHALAHVHRNTNTPVHVDLHTQKHTQHDAQSHVNHKGAQTPYTCMHTGPPPHATLCAVAAAAVRAVLAQGESAVTTPRQVVVWQVSVCVCAKRPKGKYITNPRRPISMPLFQVIEDRGESRVERWSCLSYSC